MHRISNCMYIHFFNAQYFSSVSLKIDSSHDTSLSFYYFSSAWQSAALIAWDFVSRLCRNSLITYWADLFFKFHLFLPRAIGPGVLIFETRNAFSTFLPVSSVFGNIGPQAKTSLKRLLPQITFFTNLSWIFLSVVPTTVMFSAYDV